jgi:carbamoylphosphate synthase small subunit
MELKTYYSHLFDYPKGAMEHLFSEVYGLTRVTDPKDAQIIIWNGGADIGTEIYNAQTIVPGVPFKMSSRDEEEIELFNRFKNSPDILKLGICRGAQLLCCLNGGRLWQDVNKHGYDHEMIDLTTNEVLTVTSTHHQQMYVDHCENGKIIGIANCSTIKYGFPIGRYNVTNSEKISRGTDVEIVWYKDTTTLCIQGHPEYVPNSRFADYTFELIERCWNDRQTT